MKLQLHPSPSEARSSKLEAFFMVMVMGFAAVSQAGTNPAPAKPGSPAEGKKTEESASAILNKPPMPSLFRDLKPTEPGGRDPFSPVGYVKPKVAGSGTKTVFEFTIKPIGPHGNQAYLEDGTLLEEGKAYPYSEDGEPTPYTVTKITNESVTATYKEKSYTFPFEFVLKPKSLIYPSAILNDGTAVDLGAEYPYKDKNGTVLGTYKVLAITENDITVSYKGKEYSFPFVQGDLNQFQEK